ncbi:MAG: endonuclease [Bacteroidota bacterium]|nr:endonuclease [Bacteroidota bacterium]
MKPFLQIFSMLTLFIISFYYPPPKARGIHTEKYAKASRLTNGRHFVRIAFYNTENMYDPGKDSTKSDDEFTPAGARKWTYTKFYSKLNHLGKTILAMGDGEPPAAVGLCEIENRRVLNCLTASTPLRPFRYQVVHYDSPDLRGVDVALLYRPERLRILYSIPIAVRFPQDSSLRTRDILYAKGILENGDTLHLFVNHWPSRRGGAKKSSGRRAVAASILRRYVDSLFRKVHHPGIIIMGDFNDEPADRSLENVLQANPVTESIFPDRLYNLMFRKLRTTGSGTIKYQGKWSVFDQIIVSGTLLLKESGYVTHEADASIFRGKFLLQEDEKHMGDKLYRTYQGPSYKGGFSDHLPVYLDLTKK